MPETKSSVRLDQKTPAAAAPQAGHPELPAELRQRVVIDRVGPEVDAGRFPVKRVVGDVVVVEADIFPKIYVCLKVADEWVRKHAATAIREVCSGFLTVENKIK